MVNFSIDIYKLREKIKKVRLKYDLNMKYFKSLSREKFNEELNKLVDEENFIEITDLSTLTDVPGYYIMVLDDYCLVYIGISHQIKERIMRHWSAQVPLNLLFLGVERGLLPIDCFRALDTTRIFVCLGNEDNFSDDHMINMLYEDKLIYKFPVDYCLNISTFYGGRERQLERMRNLELLDLKVYNKSPITTIQNPLNQRALKK